ncbi:MAG: molybdenum cofactor biosynthesis protein B [Thermoplasmata archaeon]
MSVEEHKARAPKEVPCAVITASDTRTPETDDAGQYVRGSLERAGHSVTYYAVVKDEKEAILGALEEALRAAAVVIINGGTGLAPRDVTIEAVETRLDKRLEGFGEIFRWLSYQEIGSSAMMSRAMAGVIGEHFVACLPGSPRAVRLAVDKLLLPELGHIVQQVRAGRRGGGHTNH